MNLRNVMGLRRIVGVGVLVLALTQGFSPMARAAPNATDAGASATADVALLTAYDGPGHHFGFRQASVLAQTTPEQTQTAVAAQATQQAASPPPLTGSGACTTQVNQVCTIAGNVSGTWQKTGSGAFTVTALTPATAVLNDGAPIVFLPTTAGVEQRTCSVPTAVGTAVVCQGTTVGDLLQGGTVTVRFVTTGGFQDVTGTVTGPVTPTGPLTSQQAVQLAQAAAGFNLGQPGVPCATLFGQVCQVVGAVAGIGIVTGEVPGGVLPGPGLPPAPPGPVPGIGPGFGPWADMSWNLTANAPSPAGTTAGTPFAVFNTTSGFEAFPCAAVSGGAASATCVVTTTGIAFEGSSVAVVFPGTGGVALGTVHGQLVVPFPPGPPPPPPPPPPPLELIAPPPPPIAGPGPGFPGFPEVPVIPEADSLFLLAGGLALVGGLAGWAALRRRAE